MNELEFIEELEKIKEDVCYIIDRRIALAKREFAIYEATLKAQYEKPDVFPILKGIGDMVRKKTNG